MTKNKDFKSIIDFSEIFTTEQHCIDYCEKNRWKGNITSPFDPNSKVYKCANNQYRCKNTGRYFNVKTGTIFENSKISLRKWLYTLYIFTNHKKGISSLQLAREFLSLKNQHGSFYIDYDTSPMFLFLNLC